MNPRTVLIVEDEAESAVTLEVALESLPGITTVRVPSAEAALDAFERFMFAAVVSDVQLPAMSGIELIARVHHLCRALPVVIVSASASAGVERDALRAGAAAFFAKPFSPAAVCEKLRQLLKESQDV
jgi:CheY-like chemotaxis protein